MPNWNQILDELKETGSTYDVVRRKYLKALASASKRNVIAYYSGWLEKPRVEGLSINDGDKNGFMSVVHGLDRSKGVDLILHTPGGDLAATESIVDYLRAMFGTNIRVIVPQLAMSAGTMIACSARSILMGKHSSLGPIDPQFRGVPAHGIIEEFTTAFNEIKADPAKQAVWGPILSKYSPTLLGESKKALDWSEQLVTEWLKTGMFAGDPDVDTKIANVVKELGDHSLNLNHSRHIGSAKAKDIGLVIEDLEAPENKSLQDAVLSVHHATVHTLASTDACKIVENHKGTAVIRSVRHVVVNGGNA